MAPRAEPDRTAIVVACGERRGLAGALLEEAFGRVVETASEAAALCVLGGNGDGAAFAFVDLGSSDRSIAAASRLARQAPALSVAVACDGPLPDLPPNAIAVPRPWRSLVLLIEAERALLRAPWMVPERPSGGLRSERRP